ncbi:MXAN_6640 family putative metalloprotease [Geomonas edaphica]|uniref:MXAN_6640 family putative metalloprotease n=1 Tax=Geomonas edaphica TaxID=2570226 RepID=UPI0010A7E906|nr:MXAN_6640 family putative metalloprotease [Geomonas edaphica]
MVNKLFASALCAALLFPAFASAAALDDYYLARFGHEASVAKALSSVQSQTTHAERCRTGFFRQLKKDWSRLEAPTQKVLAKYLARPSLSKEKTCTPVGGHFTIHYTTSGGDAVDTTDNNGNGVPDWVETVAGVFEYVYSVEVEKMGYHPPPDTSYDVYLQDLATDAVYGYTQNDSTPVTGSSVSYSSWIQIDRSFTAPIFSDYTPITSLRITAAHEFHHAIQFGYNAYFDTAFAEMTSTWMEDEVYDSGNQLYDYLWAYFSRVDTVAVDAGVGSGTEYGRWIFNRYLTELQQSRTAIRAVWTDLAAQPRPSNTTSPDLGVEIPFIPSLDTVLKGNLGNNFFGFAKRTVLSDWESHLLDLPTMRLITSRDLKIAQTNTVDGTIPAPAISLPAPYTFQVYKYLPANPDGTLMITFTGLPATVVVAAEKVGTSGVTEYPYNASSQSITVPLFGAGDVVYLIACNNGNGDLSDPVVVSPAFQADKVTVTDGTGLGNDGLVLDANRLTIPSQSTGGGGGGGGCFIATAAYGSYLHPKVAELRAFRDHWLMTNAPGRLFVSAYYRLSPPIADVIAGHEWMKSGVRGMLLPLIFAVEHPMAALVLLLFMSAAVMRQGARRLRAVSLRGRSGAALR